MSTFNPGTNGTLKSTNLVAAFFECAYVLQALERPIPTIDTTQITIDSNAATATFALEMPIQSSLNTSGNLVISTTDYIPNDTFVNGNGALKSVTTPDAFLELAQLIVASEASRNAANPNDIINNVTFDLDLVDNTVTVNATIPFTEQIVNGVPSLIATDYLP